MGAAVQAEDCLAAEFASAIVRAIDEPHRNGDTVYVGGQDYLS